MATLVLNVVLNGLGVAVLMLCTVLLASSMVYMEAWTLEFVGACAAMLVAMAAEVVLMISCMKLAKRLDGGKNGE